MRFVVAIAESWRNVVFAEFNFFAAAAAAAFFSASIFLAASICAWVGFGGAAMAEAGIKLSEITRATIFLFINLIHPAS